MSEPVVYAGASLPELTAAWTQTRMNFGKPDCDPPSGLSLPADYWGNTLVLPGKLGGTPKVFVGCAAWGDEGFVGKIYPVGVAKKDFLRHYAMQFNAVELNATGFSIPDAATVEGWSRSVPDGFVFCPKVPQTISHNKSLGSNKIELQRFCDAIGHFKSHLGTVFLQLYDSFGFTERDKLLDLLDWWESRMPLHVELRDESWFQSGGNFDQIIDELRTRNVGTVITDTATRRDALHQALTTRSAFIRFNASDISPSAFSRLDVWAVRISEWI